MKECRKCKKEYKEKYSYCPKCGTPYDKTMKKVKTPKISDIKYMTKKEKTIYIILYVIGIMTILTGIRTIANRPLDSIIPILFGISLLPITYEIIEDKFNIYSEKTIKLLRILIPIIILIINGMIDPEIFDSNNSVSNNNTNEEEVEKIEEEVIDEEDEKTTEEITKEEYTLEYNKLGEYGKEVEYEGENEYFYYFPSGTYEIKSTRMSGSICFLWIDYNSGYKTEYGTAYTNKEKLQFNNTTEKKTITLTDDTHIYNSNNCDYKLTKTN